MCNATVGQQGTGARSLERRSFERRSREHNTMQEGLAIWARRQQDVREKRVKEQREVRDMLEKHWPWGRPGGGAPNGPAVGLRNLRLEGLYPEKDYKKNKRTVGTFQFGVPDSGAPHRFNGVREDPQLRFQFCQSMRKCVDNSLRYRTTREEQETYRRQLDAMVEEKRQAREDERRKTLEYERKMGWTNANNLKKLDERTGNGKINLKDDILNIKPSTLNKKQSPLQPINKEKIGPLKQNAERETRTPKFERNGVRLSPLLIKTNGVELVPLLARHRAEHKIPLGSTDVTEEHVPHRWQNSKPELLRELSTQVTSKYQRKLEERIKENESCVKHFETWAGFWGRPGNGAPRSTTLKGNLDHLLYPQVRPVAVH